MVRSWGRIGVSTPVAQRYGVSTPFVNLPQEAPFPMPKKPRADALRNRIRVLEAAEAVFAAKGHGASTEEVARQAGVGAGTVFRHFPTKEALLEAIVIGRLG